MDEENRYDSLRSWMSTVTYILNCMYFVLKLSPFNCRSFASISFDIVLIQQQGLISNFKIPVVVRKYRDPPQKLFFIRISPSINIGSGSEYSPIRSVIIWGVIAAKILFQILLCRTFVLYKFFSENTRTEI